MTNLVSEYDSKRGEYEKFTNEISSEIERNLRKESIKYLTVTGRTKTVDSLSDKLNRKGKDKYTSLSEIPDLSGVRIVVTHRNMVDEVREIIETLKFHIVDEIDRGAESDSDQKGCFGYSSLHVVIQADDSDKVAEVQICTLLQHSWATFSHHHYYKKEGKVDEEWKHDLFMLSAVLQLADKQFASLLKYEDHLIKGDELQKFLDPHHQPLLRQLVEHARKAKFKISSSETDEPADLSKLIWVCQRSGIRTPVELKKVLQRALEHNDNYLTELHDKIGVSWTVELAFLVELMLYKVCPTHFTVTDLIEQHWSKHLAEKVHKIAEKYHHKDHCDEHH